MAPTGFLSFLPIILRRGLGYSAFVLTVLPGAAAIIYGLSLSWAADKHRMRGPFILYTGHYWSLYNWLFAYSQPRYVGSFHGQCGTNGLIVTGLAGVKTT